MPLDQKWANGNLGEPFAQLNGPRAMDGEQSLSLGNNQSVPPAGIGIKKGFYCRYYKGERFLIPNHVRRPLLEKVGFEVLEIEPWSTAKLEAFFKESNRDLKRELDYWKEPKLEIKEVGNDETNPRGIDTQVKVRSKNKPTSVGPKKQKVERQPPPDKVIRPSKKKQPTPQTPSLLDVLCAQEVKPSDSCQNKSSLPRHASRPGSRDGVFKVTEVIEQLEEVEAQVHRMQTQNIEDEFPLIWDHEPDLLLTRYESEIGVMTAIETRRRESSTRKRSRPRLNNIVDVKCDILHSDLYIPKDMPRNLEPRNKAKYLLEKYCKDLVLTIQIEEFGVGSFSRYDNDPKGRARREVAPVKTGDMVRSMNSSRPKSSSRKNKSTNSPTRRTSTKRKVDMSPANFTDSEREENERPEIPSLDFDSDSNEKCVPRKSTDSSKPLNQALRNLMDDIDELNASASPSEFPPVKRLNTRKNRSISDLPLEPLSVALPVLDTIEQDNVEENNMNSSTDVDEESLSGSQLESIIGQVMAENEEAKSIESSQEQLDGDDGEYIPQSVSCQAGADGFSISPIKIDEKVKKPPCRLFEASNQATKSKTRTTRNTKRKPCKKGTPVMKAAAKKPVVQPAKQQSEQLVAQVPVTAAVPVTLEFNSSRPLNYIQPPLNVRATPEKQVQATNSYGYLPQALPPKYQHKTLQNQSPVRMASSSAVQQYLPVVNVQYYQQARPQHSYSQANAVEEPPPAHQQVPTHYHSHSAKQLIPLEQPHIVQKKPRGKKVGEQPKRESVPVVVLTKETPQQHQQNVPMTTYYHNFVPQQLQAAQFSNYPAAMSVQPIQNSSHFANNQSGLLHNQSQFQVIQNRVVQPQQSSYMNYPAQGQQFFISQPMASSSARNVPNIGPGNQSYLRTPQFQAENQAFVIEPTPYQQTDMWPLGQPQQPQNSQLPSNNLSLLNEYAQNYSEQLQQQASSSLRTNNGQTNDNLVSNNIFDFNAYLQNYN